MGSASLICIARIQGMASERPGSHHPIIQPWVFQFELATLVYLAPSLFLSPLCQLNPLGLIVDRFIPVKTLSV
jgi:hypothetical protein